MSDIIQTSSSREASTNAGAMILAPAPKPRIEVSIRPAQASDVPFIDQLQKMHSHMVGFFPLKQIETHIKDGNIVVAECPPPPGGPAMTPIQLGYCLAKDQYMRRDDVGIVYQLNVAPIRQRNLIGASLIKATFEKAAYGCRLFSCWCAQDIQANYFWESIGFVPLAFRTGARRNQRIHIFWQRRVRDDDEITPYWFPAQTQNGAVAEDRIVVPIPPGTHWRDPMPILMPTLPQEEVKPLALPPTRPPATKVSTARKMAIVRSKSRHLQGLPPGKAAVMTSGGIKYIDRGDYVPEAEPAKPKRTPKPRAKHDSKIVAQARELRDRYLEQVNADRLLPGANGKYDVSRQLPPEAQPRTAPAMRLGDDRPMRLLEAA